MRILIITNYPFPLGMAQTNRIIAMAKGLIHAGADVELVVSKATELGKPKNTAASGNYQGIKFTYATGTPIRPHGIAKRAFLFYKGILGTMRFIIKENKKQKIDALFMGVYSNLITYMVFLLTRLLSIKYIQERSEYPFLSYTGNIIGRTKLRFYLRFICARFDGFLVISSALENYFRPYMKGDTKTHLIPILVETERFIQADSPSRNVISYCGSMQGTKDGVPLLIEAFSKIASQFPETDLQLIGPTNFEGFSHLQAQINDLGLSNRIVFTGRVERDEMPGLLQESRILALARPPSKQSEGGFPTKLGEYLATGRLSVVTGVGDIPDYLVHAKNALLAEPGNVEDFAKQLEYGLAHESERKIMGKEGRMLAENVFSYKIQGDKLFNWLKTFV
jgi:glycosyltransferase involved in cell wall biosynthesis